ncbi:MAG: ABC transporter related protein [Parcubacteria group bacterium GW2011_GWC2_45_7]|nr:MAG: ABC transporter related protein [Parcubacteria group bacterium GW2011_GWC2_45_7]KKU71882.1 MAG: ABC transporter related protein [Parcubacteria group bacterium GW2011_GWA2_47_26]HCE48851.1 hypothetical protein [Candidatus Jacksonbacteria bacterium]
MHPKLQHPPTEIPSLSAEGKIIDPICGMNLDDLPNLVSLVYKGQAIHFCDEGCKKRFEADPERFSKMPPLIQLKNVWKIFKIGDTKIEVLRNLSLHIWEGDFIAIIGASGSGKSTVLNMIGALDKPTAGQVFYRDKDITTLKDAERAELRAKTFGFVFQQYNLIPWLTAYENMLLPLTFITTQTETSAVKARLSEIGLGERLNHRPFELSGGEQQRVALIRALTNNPEVILGDEPTGNLDSSTGEKILGILINLNKKQNKTLIIVTHDADIASQADQVITIKDGQMIRDHRAHKKIYTE